MSPMGILTSAFISTVTAAETHFEIPFSPAVYGLGAFGGLMALLAITFAFRSVAKRQYHQ
jgi:hypothetical protein